MSTPNNGVTEDTDLDLIALLESLDAPRCDWTTDRDGEPATSDGTLPADCQAEATWLMSASCGHDALFCGEHAADVKAQLLARRERRILCQKHGAFVTIEWRVL